MRFLENSNLPPGAVTLCAVSGQDHEVLAALEKRGIACVKIRPISGLQTPVASHADLQLCHLGGARVLASAADPALPETLARHGFDVETAAPLGASYPGDVRLNCAIVGKFCFAAPAYIDKAITAHCAAHRIEIVPVKQGYTKCATCIVGERAIITADRGIATAAERVGFAVLCIVSGHIRLDGYDAGFIGGCSGLLAPRLIAFTGKLSSHPDGDKIAQFLAAQQVEYVELTEAPLVDLGSILPLCEG